MSIIEKTIFNFVISIVEIQNKWFCTRGIIYFDIHLNGKRQEISPSTPNSLGKSEGHHDRKIRTSFNDA